MRANIKDEIKSALLEIKELNGNVFINHRKSGVYPFLSVFFEEEEAKQHELSPRSTKRTLNFSIQTEMNGDQIEKIDRYFDVLSDSIEEKIFELREKTQLLTDIRYMGARPDYNTEAGRPSVTLVLGFCADYIKKDFVERESENLEQLFLEINNNE